ncbi:MAG: 2-hydroxyacyl-CoA dehydratase family protein [Clostridia bacterium]|nr:2-hydroxyacyl-CoA dehydratase family protein [Clostridia bacterium]
MELIKNLPAVFEEFADARKNAFINVKNVKESGMPVIGSYCTYFPTEIATAAGAASVSLCSTSGETIPDAEKDLPANLCPLIKSSYGFAKTDKCPFFYFSDLVVGETTCDGKKKMYELMSEFKDVFIMELPNSQKETALAFYKTEVLRMKEYVEKKFGVEITDEKIRAAVKLENEIRLAKKRLAEVMKHTPTPVTGLNMFKLLYGSTFKFDRAALPAELNGIADKIEEEYAAGKMEEKKPRIIITGCPIGGVTEKVIEAVENNGGVVVGFENCVGAKLYENLVDEKADDIWLALTKRYLDIGCSVMTPNMNRPVLLGKMIDEYQADGVLEMTLQTCHTYNIEHKKIEAFCRDQKKKPYLMVETDYSTADIAQLNTRIAAFIEMM